MTRKLVAIVFSLVINFVVLAWFHAWSTPVVASATPATARAATAPTLPTITVRPTRAQIESLRRDRKPAATGANTPTGDGGMQMLVMPFYSFAGQPGAASEG